MSNVLDLLRLRQEKTLKPQKFLELQYSSKRSLYSMDLKAHFGCVNALSFSNSGQFLASGGDDRRILLWDVSQALDRPFKAKTVMKATHESNVFCIDFDCKSQKLFSGGNDEKLLIHNLHSGEIQDIFPHDEPVYCVCSHPESPELLTTACSDGRIQLIDLRAKNEDPTMLQGSSYAFHGVDINPCDARLLVTANQEEGVSLLDFRKPNQPIMKYGTKVRKRSAMCAKFSPDGSKIFALGRRLNPVLYDLAHPKALVEFDHPGYFNSCTMKSGSFGENYVFSGSDNFAVYGWKIPDTFDDGQTMYIKRAQLELHGHRSIVNQVRFNSSYSILATSGVEKKIKFWCPFNITKSDQHDTYSNRRLNGRQDLFWMLQASSDFGQDCEHESTEENLSMLAFFDSLVQRDLSSGDSDSDETLSLDENDFNDDEENIESVIAKKRQVVHKRRIRGNPSQDNEDLRLTIQNARDVLLSDKLPENLVNEPEADGSIKEAILKDLESEINFYDTSSSSSNEEEQETKNNSLKNSIKNSTKIRSEYVQRVVKRALSSSDEDDISENTLKNIDCDDGPCTSSTTDNLSNNIEPQPSTSNSVCEREQKSLNKSSNTETNNKNIIEASCNAISDNNTTIEIKSAPQASTSSDTEQKSLFKSTNKSKSKGRNYRKHK